MKIVLLYVTSYLFIFNVFFPLISYPRKKEDKIIFNQSPIIDILKISNLLFIIYLSWFYLLGYEWIEWLLTSIFLFLLCFLEILNILSSWHSEIIIDKEFIYIRKMKYDYVKFKRERVSLPKKIKLGESSFMFFKDWDSEHEIFYWKKFTRANFLKINNEIFNLNEYNLNIYFYKLYKVLEEKIHAENINIKMNQFEKYYCMRWIFTLLFILSLFYYFI
jgi:hypothetical protein